MPENCRGILSQLYYPKSSFLRSRSINKIKAAIQTSLGIIVLIAISACIGHALQGNVLFVEGLLLGTGGLIALKEVGQSNSLVRNGK